MQSDVMTDKRASTVPTRLDFVGDVHGCYQPLKKLLERLGYVCDNGVYSHPQRQVIFVGDLIDRGPGIRETLQLVYNMWQAGSARVVLGNHEYNAVRYPQETLDYLLAGGHNRDGRLPERVQTLMQATLHQFLNYPQEWQVYTDWFAGLPLFIEEPGYRVVHACWDEAMIEAYRQHYPESGLTPEFVEASRQSGSLESRIVDRLTRGTSMPLPEGVHVQGKDGFIRRFFRTKFWEDSPQTYGDVVFQPDPLPYDLAEHPIKEDHQHRLVRYDNNAPPVFFGHYWLKGRPRQLQDNVACLDYSAVSFGRLTAYCFEGEAQLREDHFQWVYVDRSDHSRPTQGKKQL